MIEIIKKIYLIHNSNKNNSDKTLKWNNCQYSRVFLLLLFCNSSLPIYAANISIDNRNARPSMLVKFISIQELKNFHYDNKQDFFRKFMSNHDEFFHLHGSSPTNFLANDNQEFYLLHIPENVSLDEEPICSSCCFGCCFCWFSCCKKKVNTETNFSIQYIKIKIGNAKKFKTKKEIKYVNIATLQGNLLSCSNTQEMMSSGITCSVGFENTGSSNISSVENNLSIVVNGDDMRVKKSMHSPTLSIVYSTPSSQMSNDKNSISKPLPSQSNDTVSEDKKLSLHHPADSINQSWKKKVASAYI
ncbi:MAG: hypothetical protein HRT87_00245 [Legionellales bacterium]|nr:hypothetical protein [Legionellales bacterium]